MLSMFSSWLSKRSEFSITPEPDQTTVRVYKKYISDISTMDFRLDFEYFQDQRQFQYLKTDTVKIRKNLKANTKLFAFQEVLSAPD